MHLHMLYLKFFSFRNRHLSQHKYTWYRGLNFRRYLPRPCRYQRLFYRRLYCNHLDRSGYRNLKEDPLFLPKHFSFVILTTLQLRLIPALVVLVFSFF